MKIRGKSDVDYPITESHLLLFMLLFMTDSLRLCSVRDSLFTY